MLSSSLRISCESFKNKSLDIEIQKCKTRRIEKCNKLLERSNLHRCDDAVSAKWVVNISNFKLDQDQTEALKKGLNFAPAPEKVPVTQIISSVEKGLRNIPPQVAAKARKQISHLMVKSRIPPTNLQPNLRKALKTLRENKDIIILPADKGRATVVMNKEDYEDKIGCMLSDERTYQRVDKDPASSLERKLNSLLLSLKKKGSLCQTTYDRLRSTGGLTPFIYSLPKIHKPDVPLRPIVSFCTSPSY